MKKMFSEIVGKYIGKSFKAGAHGDGGYGCVDLIHALCVDLEKKVPNRFRDWDLKNYVELYQTDRLKAEAVLLDLSKTLGEEVSVHELVAGDILICRQERGNLFPALYVGNGNAISAFTRAGVNVFKLDAKNKPICARRLN